VLLDLVVINELQPGRAGSEFPRDVVLGRSKAAGRYDNVRPPQCIADGFLETFAVVADNGFHRDVDADVIKLPREPKTVGVGPVRREKLGAYRDDLCCKHPACQSL
jgi:hypothetical protein